MLVFVEMVRRYESYILDISDANFKHSVISSIVICIILSSMIAYRIPNLSSNNCELNASFRYYCFR